MRDQGLLHPGASFLWLAGRPYQQYLSALLSSFPQKDPLAGMGIGKRLGWLKAQLA